MEIQLTDATVKGALPPVTLKVTTGEAAYICTTTDQRPTVIGLVATGRMRVTSGQVLINGDRRRKYLRNFAALVDAPTVSAPADDVWTAGMVAEELMFAGKWGHVGEVVSFLREQELSQYFSTAAADLPPHVRIKLLLELAARRPGVQFLVLVSPDRHGGSPQKWWPIIEEMAARGYGVLAIVGQASASLLAHLGKKSAGEHVGEGDIEPRGAASWKAMWQAMRAAKQDFIEEYRFQNAPRPEHLLDNELLGSENQRQHPTQLPPLPIPPVIPTKLSHLATPNPGASTKDTTAQPSTTLSRPRHAYHHPKEDLS